MYVLQFAQWTITRPLTISQLIHTWMECISRFTSKCSLEFHFLDEELNTIKQSTTLATSVDDTWISVESVGVFDIFGNELVPIGSDNVLQASNYTGDTTRPNLVDFDLDLNVGVLTLIFDETVRSSSLNLTQITLQDTPYNATNTYTLTEGMWTEEDSPVIVVTLSFFDLNQIKKIRELASIDPNGPPMSGGGSACVSASGSASSLMVSGGSFSLTDGNTYISITSETVEDMNSNPIVEITPDSAKPVREITLDTTPPQLVSFDFDLNSERIILTFTETVDTLTLTLDQFTILGNPFSRNYTLMGGHTPSEDDYIIVIQLDIEDVNNIKRMLDVAVDEASTTLYLTPSAIQDMNQNPINFTSPLVVSNFTEDSRPPILLSFDLDMDSNLLTLTFNETVRVPSLNVTQITFQDNVTLNSTDSSSFRTLELGVALTTDDPVVVQPVDTNYIKAFTNLATSENTTFISLTDSALTDTNNNPVSPIFDDDAFQIELSSSSSRSAGVV